MEDLREGVKVKKEEQSGKNIKSILTFLMKIFTFFFYFDTFL